MMDDMVRTQIADGELCHGSHDASEEDVVGFFGYHNVMFRYSWLMINGGKNRCVSRLVRYVN